MRDDLVERDEAHGCALWARALGLIAGLGDEVLDAEVAGEDVGDLDAREAGFGGLGRARGFDEDPEVEREVGDEGEAVAGVYGEGGEDGEDFALIPGGERGLFLRGEVVVGDDPDSFVAEVGAEGVDPEGGDLFLLVDDHAPGFVEDLRGGEVPGFGRLWSEVALDPEFVEPDAFHEELVEVGGGDREELDALEEGDVRVVGLGDDPVVELEPGEVSVEIEPFLRVREGLFGVWIVVVSGHMEQ